MTSLPSPDPLTAVWQLTPDLSAAGEARCALRTWLAGLRIDSASGVGADLIVSASELVTNAVTHGKPPVCLAARVDLTTYRVPTLVISVTDGGTPLRDQPAPSVPACDSEGGRGLAIVAALADWWQVTTEWNATQVRAGFPVPDLPVPAPRHGERNTLPGMVESGTRTGLPPAASLSALR